MSYFLRFFAFIFAISIAGNVYAAGYDCPDIKQYTSCSPGYYMTYGGVYDPVPKNQNACTPCPAGCTCLTEGTAAPVCSITITISKNGGTGSTSATAHCTASTGTNNITCTCPNGSACALPAHASLTKANSTISGWNSNSSGTGTNYTTSGTFTGSTTIYAKWTTCTACATTNASCTLSVVGNACTYTTGCNGGFGGGTPNTYNHTCTACADGTYSVAGSNTCSNCSGLGTTGQNPTGGTYSSVSSRDAATTCRYTGTAQTIPGCATATPQAVPWSGSSWSATPYVVTANPGYTVSGSGTAAAACPACSASNTDGACGCPAGQRPSGSGCSSCTISCSGVSGYTLGSYNQCSGSDSTCYRNCTTSDVTGSTTVSGTVTKGGANTCAATGCSTGYTLSGGTCVLNTYTITLNKNGGSGTTSGATSDSGGTANATKTCTHGLPCTLPSAGSLANTGKTFAGWGTSAGCTSGVFSETFTGAATRYACWSTDTIPCNAGYYLKAGTTTCNTLCTSGNYCVGGNFNYSASVDQGLTPCPTNYTSGGTGLSAQNQCKLQTTGGTYIKTANDTVTTPCPAGSACPAALISYGSTGSIAQCTNTTYSGAGAATCSSCPPNYTANTTAGKTAISQCQITTTAGTYIKTANDTSVTVCPAGSACPAATINYGSTGSITQCTNATYSGSGAATCSSCPPNYTANTTAGKTAVSQCQITTTAGTYIKTANDTVTTPCPAGSACPAATINYGSTGSIAQCTGATYSGASAASCSSCTANYTANTTAGKTAISQCQISCAAGTRVVTANAGCTTPSGSWYTGAHNVNYGSTSSVSSCVTGYSTPNTTTATDHDALTDCRITCPANTTVAAANAQCTPCPAGHNNSGDTVTQGSTGPTCNISSYTCPAGQYLPANSTSCVTCTTGHWCPGGNFNYNSIDQGLNSCPTTTSGWTAGTGTGWSSYTSCYQIRNATDVSSYCAAGQLRQNANTATTWGASTITTAFTAKAGAYVNGQTCSQCAAGTYQGTNGSTATSCPSCSGAVYSGVGAASCTPCPTVTSGWTLGTGTGWTSYASCNQTRNATDVSAYCAAGQLRQVANTSTTWGASTISTAFTAKAGAYVNGQTCSQCAVGTYQGTNGSNATSCSICGTGTYAGTVGSASCSSCPSEYTTSGTTAADHDSITDCLQTCEEEDIAPPAGARKIPKDDVENYPRFCVYQAFCPNGYIAETGGQLDPDDSTYSSNPICENARFDITFIPNGGVIVGGGASYTKQCQVAKSCVLDDNQLFNFQRTGYAFSGWAKTSSGSVVYQNGMNIAGLEIENVNLFAIWNNCAAGYTWNGYECSICPPGKWKAPGVPASGNAVSCNSCAPGETTDTAGATSASSCKPCPEGYFCGDGQEAKSCDSLGDGSWELALPGAQSASDCYKNCPSYPITYGTAQAENDIEFYDTDCKYYCVSNTGNRGSITTGTCVETSCNSNYEMINGKCELCNRENALSYKPGSNCEISACVYGYHPNGQACEENVVSCNAPNATDATRTWNTSTKAFGICTINACEDGYHVASNACVLDDQECAVPNGIGTKQWDSVKNKWGECQVTYCKPGYTSDRSETNELTAACGQCKNKFGVFGELVASTYVAGCEIASCLYQGELYNLEDNECVPVCSPNGYEDETGTMTWDTKNNKCIRQCKDGFTAW